MRKRHFVVYFENFIAVTKSSKDWARENRQYFPAHTFSERDLPTSNKIDLYLVDNLGFTLSSDKEKFVCFKLVN